MYKYLFNLIDIEFNSAKLYTLKRNADEILINDYNPLLLLLWQANIDIQYIHENSMVLNRYISCYVTKSEKTACDSIWNVCSKNKTLQSGLKTFALQSLKHRELGAFEVADKLMGHSLFNKSATVKWLGIV